MGSPPTAKLPAAIVALLLVVGLIGAFGVQHAGAEEGLFDSDVQDAQGIDEDGEDGGTVGDAASEEPEAAGQPSPETDEDLPEHLQEPGFTMPERRGRRAGEAPDDDSGDAALPMTYTMRIQEIEDRVNVLKDDVFRSKSRLFLLREQILQDRLGGARIVVRHLDESGARYRLESVVYSLNGVPVRTGTRASGTLPREGEVIHDRGATMGAQNLSVQYELVGSRLGLFGYMDHYRFTLRSSYAFVVEDGQTVEVAASIYQRRGVNRVIEERLDVAFDVEVRESLDEVARDGHGEMEAR